MRNHSAFTARHEENTERSSFTISLWAAILNYVKMTRGFFIGQPANAEDFSKRGTDQKNLTKIIRTLEQLAELPGVHPSQGGGG